MNFIVQIAPKCGQGGGVKDPNILQMSFMDGPKGYKNGSRRGCGQHGQQAQLAKPSLFLSLSHVNMVIKCASRVSRAKSDLFLSQHKDMRRKLWTKYEDLSALSLITMRKNEFRFCRVNLCIVFTPFSLQIAPDHGARFDDA